jgi:hypothetical protein
MTCFAPRPNRGSPPPPPPLPHHRVALSHHRVVLSQRRGVKGRIGNAGNRRSSRARATRAHAVALIRAAPVGPRVRRSRVALVGIFDRRVVELLAELL